MMKLFEAAFYRLMAQSGYPGIREEEPAEAGEIRAAEYTGKTRPEAENFGVQAVAFTEKINLDELDQKTEDRLRRSVRALD